MNPTFRLVYCNTEFGRRIIVIKHKVDTDIVGLNGKRYHDWYCGYVEILPTDTLYQADEELLEEKLDRYTLGGVTYTGNFDDLGIDVIKNHDGTEPFFIGFDTNHFYNFDSTFADVKNACKQLAYQLSLC